MPVTPFDRGRLVASVLEGAWRASPGAASIRQDELKVVLPILVRSGTAGLAWRRLRNTALASTEPGRSLQSARRIGAAHAAIRMAQIEQLLCQDEMQQADPILVKGWANARSYPEERLRHYTDIDLLVQPARYEEAVRAAAKAVPPDPGRALRVDIQPIFKDLPDRSWEQIRTRSRRVRLGSHQATVLGDEDTLRLTSLHLLRHLAAQPMWLCDVSVLVENVPGNFDWDYFLSGIPRRTEWMLAVIKLANQLLGASLERCPPVVPRAVPSWMTTAVLRRWGTEASYQYPWPLPRHIVEVVRADPRRLPQAFAKRWPDPIQAIGRYGWPINRLSGRTAQLLDYSSRALTWTPRQLGLLRRKATAS